MSSGSTQTKETDTQSAPWWEQIPYLKDAFAQAQGLYQQGTGNLYNGQQIAQYNPHQLETFRSMLGYANNSDIPHEQAQFGRQLSGTGQNAITDALGQLANFKPTGGTQENIDAASQYANNPAISGMVQAAMRDSLNNANENVLPALARSANAGGNLNSNRTAISQGIVQRGLADQAGDISANLRGQAYQQGLNLAEQNSEFSNNAMLNALQNSGALGATASGLGQNALDQSLASRLNLFNLANQGGAGLQASDQAAIDNAKAMSEYGSNRPFDLLARYFGIVGGTGYGGTSQGTETTTSSSSNPFGTIGGILNAFRGFF